MAFLFRREDNVTYQEDLQCPICLEDFFEPKLLPCLHSLCAACIEELASSSSRSISCPLCRAECKIPNGGAKKLPSSTKLEKLLKDAPTTRAKEEIKEAINDCEENLATIKGIEKRINRAFLQEGEQVKRRIHEVCRNIVDMIRKQEKQLCKDVDHLIMNQQSNHPAALLIDKTNKLIQDINDVLERNESRSFVCDKDVFIHHLTEAKIAASKLSHIYRDVPMKTSTLEFQRNTPMMQCVSSSLFGSISYKNTTRKTTKSSMVNKGLTSDLDIIKPGTRFRSLHVPASLESKFQPYAIAGNHQGKIAVSCHGTHSVLLYKENGEFSHVIGL